MERRDHLMDQINQLSRMLGKLLADAIGLQQEGKLTEGIEMVAQVVTTTLELDPHQLQKMSEEAFKAHLNKDEKYTFTALEKLGDLFCFMAKPEDQEKYKTYLKKALICYEMAMENQPNYSFNLHQKTNEVKEKL